MSLFHRRPTPAWAWQFLNEPRATWPSWVTEYIVSTQMGTEKIGLSVVQTLLVPTRNGTQTAQRGDWLVLENYAESADGKPVGGQITLVRGQDFNNLFEPAPVPQDPGAAAEAGVA